MKELVADNFLISKYVLQQKQHPCSRIFCIVKFKIQAETQKNLFFWRKNTGK